MSISMTTMTHMVNGTEVPTMEFLMSRPLLPEAEKTHLQKVLETVVSAIEGINVKVHGIERAVSRLSEGSEEHAHGVHAVSTQVKQLGLVVDVLRHEHPVNKVVDELREATARHGDALVELRGGVDVVKEIVDNRARASDEHKAALALQIDSLQREADVRGRSVTDAVGDLASRLDAKPDAADVDGVVAQLDEVNKRQQAELDALRRTVSAAEETAKRHILEVEQLKVTLASRDRQHSEQVSALEAAVDSAQRKASHTALAEVNELRASIRSQSRKVDEAVAGVEDRVDARVSSVEAHLSAKMDEQLARRLVSIDELVSHLRDSVVRLQSEIAEVQAHSNKVEGESRATYARFRDETDGKLLELLNAVQGVEHSKTALERQVAEAGRILCQGFPLFSTNGNNLNDSPPPTLKTRHSPTRSQRPEERGASFSPPRQTTTTQYKSATSHAANGHSHSALCSCDDDIF